MKTPTIAAVLLILLPGCVSSADIRDARIASEDARARMEITRKYHDTEMAAAEKEAQAAARLKARQRYIVEKQPTLAIASAILKEEIIPGMRWPDVMAAYSFWYILEADTRPEMNEWKPYVDMKLTATATLRNISGTQTANAMRQTWVLGRKGHTEYLYFIDNKLDMIHTD